MKVFLIGFMGSGKTHWGKILSQQTSLPFFDLDEVVTLDEKRSVQQIFHDKGEEYFRIKEQEALQALAEDHDDMILSTGGGTPCFFNNIDFMKQQGTVNMAEHAGKYFAGKIIKAKAQQAIDQKYF